MSIHPSHCTCTRCARRHPSEQLYPLPIRAAVLAILTAASCALTLWAGSELRELLFTWSAL